MSGIYLTELPDRPESLLKGVAHGWNTNNPAVRSAISSLEAPSAIYCARLLVPKLEVLFSKIPEPDPRVPFEPVEIQAWRYEGTEAIPALPEPPVELMAAIADVVGSEYNLDTWGEVADRIAQEFDAVAPCHILGAMVQPPFAVPNQWPWDTMFRVQILSALMLARRREDDWLHSTYGKHLLDIVHGPVDWTTTAALIALTDRARQDEANCGPIYDLFISLLKRPGSPIWFMCVFEPILHLFLIMPGMNDEFRATIQAKIDNLYDDE